MRLLAFLVILTAAVMQPLILENFREDVVAGKAELSLSQDAVLTSLGLSALTVLMGFVLLLISNNTE